MRVWLGRPVAPFTPKQWTDNPDEAVLISHLQDIHDLEEAQGVARGFNEQEIARPTGLWAFVISDSRAKSGCRIRVRSVN